MLCSNLLNLVFLMKVIPTVTLWERANLANTLVQVEFPKATLEQFYIIDRLHHTAVFLAALLVSSTDKERKMDQCIELQILHHSTKRIAMHNTKMATVDICHHPLDKLLFAALVSKALISQISEVSKYYSLPFLNYEAAMQSFIETGGNQTLMWSSQSRHPLHSAHAFYADMVMYFCSLAERENDGVSQTSTNSNL